MLPTSILLTTDSPDEHGYEETSTGAFAARMGGGKNKNSASRLARFLLFFCQSQLAGSNPSQSAKFVDIEVDPETRTSG
jgi:hypothetical protein